MNYTKQLFDIIVVKVRGTIEVNDYQQRRGRGQGAIAPPLNVLGCRKMFV